MKIQTNYLYYNNISFKNRIRMRNNNHPRLVSGRNNPNVSVYVYEDLNSGIDIQERTFDSFTGLRDKNYLIAVLNSKIEESQKTGKPISFAMFDMDNFKSVNELLGYEVGDDFIRYTADSIDDIAKENTLSAYRFGGEEFIVVFRNQDEKTQKEIVDKIISKVNSNAYIKSKEDEYRQNALNSLAVYSIQTQKITKLYELKNKKMIYEDLKRNLTTEQAKSDPYLLDCIDSTNKQIKHEYLMLLSERAVVERDTDTKTFIIDMANAINSDKPIEDEDMKAVDEYLKFQYDKSAESFQIKKWLKSFEENNGFSMTGSAVLFPPGFVKDKTPMQLIGIAGEALKRGKQTQKGKRYYVKN